MSDNKNNSKFDFLGQVYETKNCYVPLTIEKHLRDYSECKEHIERHEILWHEWNHNKRWLIQMQQLILPSFPSYSRHDVSHSEAVLHNIELLLGEENIRLLSATDCFVLLHTVYIHDIGMCITHEDRKKIIKDGEFHEFLERLTQNTDSDLGYYARILLEECFKVCDLEDDEKRECILNQKLDVYYALTYLIAEYRRKEHGDVSRDRLLEWIEKPDKLGMGFSTIELPDRLFHIIGRCAAAHTKWDFNEILKLHQEDTGFAIDYVHPRFIAVLLQLGDALDMDNDRFHPLMKEYLGEIPNTSEIHYKKHKAIRRLRITNQKISISADCASQAELRLIRMECDNITSILKNATFFWSVIKPKDSNMCLPTFDKTEILLKGKQIPIDLVTAQFQISQDKAFSLIKGNNIYKDENFVFLRELLQNAVDATKLQYFRDCRRRLKNLGSSEEMLMNPINIGKIVSPKGYPIKIDLFMKKQVKGKIFDITSDEMKEPCKMLKDCECGVLVKITDCGIGISETDIGLIANVGSSYSSRKREIKKMPLWLQPTGTFGIGLQSVFLAGKCLKATTYTRDGKQYEIAFYPRQNGEQGYINVTPLDDRVEIWDAEPYGTTFEVFVPYSKKKLHSESPSTWDGKDPFAVEYESSKPIRHTRELLKQMALYLAEMIGESLFPVSIRIWDDGSLYDERFTKYFDENMLVFPMDALSISRNEMLPKVTWAYNLENTRYIHQDGDKNIYYLDCKHAKLYVWDQKYQAYAGIGIKRILNLREKYNSIEKQDSENGIPIFYKGILVTEKSFKEDSDLVEYIDLKMTLNQQYLKLSRSGFSSEGHKYLEEVYRSIVLTVRRALLYFGTQRDVDGTYTYLKEIETELEDLLEKKDDRKSLKKAEEMTLSIAALVYFAMVDEKRERGIDTYKDKEDGWNDHLKKVQKIVKNTSVWKYSTLFNIGFWRMVKDDISKVENTISVLDIVDEERKYAIVSMRDANGGVWKHFLLEIEEMHAKIKESVKKLRNSMDVLERKKLIHELEQIPKENLLEGTFVERNWNDLFAKKEQNILKWLISNVPTMALYASNDGNTRINVLDMEICDSVFLNFSMKKLTLDRIQEYGKVYERYSIPTWTGYQNLCLEEPRKSVKFVKRGKLSRIGYRTMFFPLSEIEMRDFIEYCKVATKSLEAEINDLYYSVFRKVLNQIKIKDITLEGRYWGKVRYYLENDDVQINNTILYRELDEKAMDVIIAGLKPTTTDENKRNKEHELWDEIMIPYLYKLKSLLSEYMNCVEMKKWFEEYCKNSFSYKNLKVYVRQHAKFPLGDVQIDDLYYCFFCEVKDCILQSQRDIFVQKLFDQKMDLTSIK